jgi:hypothetical protein
LSILGRKLALIVLLAPLFAFGQGSQLPKYTVATLPAASTQPHYIVQVIDGASSTDCATGGGAQNVACVNVAGVWYALGSVSPTFTGAVAVGVTPPTGIPNGALWNYCTTSLMGTVNLACYPGVDSTGILSNDAAFSQLVASGTNVFIPPGHYKVTQHVTPWAGQDWGGSGGRNSVIIYAPTTDTDPAAFDLANVNNVHLHDFEIDSTNVGVRIITTSDCLQAPNPYAEYNYIERLTIRNPSGRPATPGTDTGILLNGTIVTLPITSVTLTGTAAIITATNSLTAGLLVQFTGITGATGLNGGGYTVLATGLSSTQFEVTYVATAGGPYAQSLATVGVGQSCSYYNFLNDNIVNGFSNAINFGVPTAASTQYPSGANGNFAHNNLLFNFWNGYKVDSSENRIEGGFVASSGTSTYQAPAYNVTGSASSNIIDMAIGEMGPYAPAYLFAPTSTGNTISVPNGAQYQTAGIDLAPVGANRIPYLVNTDNTLRAPVVRGGETILDSGMNVTGGLVADTLTATNYVLSDGPIIANSASGVGVKLYSQYTAGGPKYWNIWSMYNVSDSDLVFCFNGAGFGSCAAYFNASGLFKPNYGISFDAVHSMLSQSSSGTQVVTCAPGGTSSQYCGADGSWHTLAATGPTSVVAGTGLNGGGSSGAVTVNCNAATASTPGCFEPDNTTITCTGSPSVCSAAVSGSGFLNTTGNQTLASSDTVSGLPAGCMQYPCLVGKVVPATYSGTTTSALTWTPATATFAAGLYRICGQLYTMAAGTGSANWGLNWQVTSADGHEFGYAIGNIANTIQWSQVNGCVSFYTDAGILGFQLQMQLYTGGGATSAPTIRYAATFEKLQ